MTLLLKQIFGFLKLLNSETGTNQLAAGLSLGMTLGFSPVISLQALLIFVLCFLFRVQLGAAFLSAFFFKFIAYLFDPLTDKIGRLVLESASLRGFFVDLYNMPLIPLTRFNNSIVMGAGIVGFALAVPLFFLFRFLITEYRFHIVSKVKGTKLWKIFQTTFFFKWYETYNKLYGA